ncbi:MAG: molybdopterin-dependent oxidoreductase [Coriobacteriales bacterium]|jgi:anaerobic selenocysteine-containing dehydrogenase
MSKIMQGEDGETIVKSCCYSPPGCHPAGCGVLLHVKDGKVVKVEGDPDHYITKGALCPRGLTIKEYMYHPDRILYPIKRAREDRGKDKWERISWDEALDIIEKNAKDITAKYGPESIFVFGGTGREGNNYYQMTAYCVFGTPNSVYAQSGWSCYGPRLSFSAYSLGVTFPDIDNAGKFHDRYDHPGWEAPKYIVLWGKEPLKSNPDGFWGHSIIEMMRYFGTKVICIDPRLTWLGTRSDEVVRLRPGTDAALGMALLNVIINEDLYDHDWVDRWTYGFDELAERVQEMPPSKAADICWVPEEQIVRVAHKMAQKPVAFGWGLAVDQNPNGAQVAQCIIALAAITGNYDIPGGTTLGSFFMSDAGDPATVAKEAGIMSEETYQKRVGAKEYPAVCTLMSTTAPDATLDFLEDEDAAFKCRMAVYHCSNPAGAAITSAPQRWYEALKQTDFAFALETFQNPTTMALCDVVLPLAAWPEHDGSVETNYTLNTSFLGSVNKAVQNGETKGDADIIVELGKRMHPEWWNQFEDGRDYIYKRIVKPRGITDAKNWDEFSDKVVHPSEEPYRKYELGLMRPDHKPGFLTKTGRVELYNSTFQAFGDDPLPYYKEPPYSPYSQPEMAKEYPLILTTGARTYVSFHSEHRQIRSLREIQPYPQFELHPDTAAELGLKEGDWCWIETPFGRAKQMLHITPCIDRRVTHAMHGWWYPEQDGEEPNLFGNWKSNINCTMPNGVNGKLGFGDCFKNMICKVYYADVQGVD